jgi:hypothetical protein
LAAQRRAWLRIPGGRETTAHVVASTSMLPLMPRYATSVAAAVEQGSVMVAHTVSSPRSMATGGYAGAPQGKTVSPPTEQPEVHRQLACASAEAVGHVSVADATSGDRSASSSGRRAITIG